MLRAVNSPMRPPSATPIIYGAGNGYKPLQQPLYDPAKAYKPSIPAARRPSPGPALLQKSAEKRNGMAAAAAVGASPIKKPSPIANRVSSAVDSREVAAIEIEKKNSYLEQLRRKQANDEALLKKKQELLEKQKVTQ